MDMTIYSGFSQRILGFSTAILHYQRVNYAIMVIPFSEKSISSIQQQPQQPHQPEFLMVFQVGLRWFGELRGLDWLVNDDFMDPILQ